MIIQVVALDGSANFRRDGSKIRGKVINRNEVMIFSQILNALYCLTGVQLLFYLNLLFGFQW